MKSLPSLRTALLAASFALVPGGQALAEEAARENPPPAEIHPGRPPAPHQPVPPGAETARPPAAGEAPPRRPPAGHGLDRRFAADRLAAGAPEDAIGACATIIALEVAAARGDGGASAPSPDSIACRLVSAAAALDLGRHDLAASSILHVRGRLGVLEPWGALLLGEALAGKGEAAEAAKVLDEARRADPRGPLGDRAEPAEALALLRAGRAAEAKLRLARLASRKRDDRDRLRLALAEATLAAGDREGAASLFASIWREAAGRPEAKIARTRLDELTAGLPKAEAPSPSDRLERAERLLDRGDARLAEAELEAIVGGGDPFLRTFLLARALSDQDRKDEAEALLAPLLAADAPDHARANDALELAARLAMRRGATDLAVARLDRIRDRSNGLRAASADFLAAFFLYDDGRFAPARERFRAHLRDHPGHRTDETRWYVGWSAYKLGAFTESIDALDALVVRQPKSPLVPQARYWRARALQRVGDPGAEAALADVASRWPDGWYGALARQHLGRPLRPGDPLPAPRPAPRPKLAGIAGARLARAEALYDAGLRDEAGLELDAALAGVKDRAILSWAARLAASSGDPARAYRLGTLRLGGLRGAPELAYPQAFADLVAAAAEEHGVDAAFIWSIMRQESGFRPKVRSPAAAVGLMQLRGVTAEKLGLLLGRPEGAAIRLEDPRDNITLGTYYLHHLLRRFGGNHALAAAAYNAGPPAVVRWLEDPTRKDLPLDEFVESIPFRETRGYVKAVIANLLAYREVHGGDALTLPAELPPVAPGIDF
ncbi:MAG TPA: transglycosylase SLT domain-containing protein [Vulgatibacter sp.]|nr:transglycosylase SLT domain-containing protein [Vulgatibacter sp.]